MGSPPLSTRAEYSVIDKENERHVPDVYLPYEDVDRDLLTDQKNSLVSPVMPSVTIAHGCYGTRTKNRAIDPQLESSIKAS